MKDLLEHERLDGKLVKSIAIGKEIDPNRFLSLLYFLGLTTILAEDSLMMTVAPPNLLILKMLWDYLRKAIEDAYRFNVDVYQLRVHLKRCRSDAIMIASENLSNRNREFRKSNWRQHFPAAKRPERDIAVFFRIGQQCLHPATTTSHS